MLDFAYLRSLYFSVNVFGSQDKKKGVILGSGSGILGDFFLHYQPNLQITEVDQQPVIDLAHRFFMYARPAVAADGATFIETVPESSENFIIVDIDDPATEEGPVPPRAFASHKFITSCYKSLTPGGVLAVATIPRSGISTTTELIEEMFHVFGNAYEVTCLKEEYKIIAAYKSVDKSPVQDWKAFGSKITEQFKTKIFKGKDDEWEDNEFADISQDIKLLTSTKQTK